MITQALSMKENDIVNKIKHKIQRFHDELHKYQNWYISNHNLLVTPALIHGDLHYGNIIWHPTKNQIVALVDWEMCSIGNPLYDLAYWVKEWHWKYIPKQMNFKVEQIPKNFIGFINVTDGVNDIGIPTERQFIKDYISYFDKDSLGRYNLMYNLNQHWVDFYAALVMYRFLVYSGIFINIIQGRKYVKLSRNTPF